MKKYILSVLLLIICCCNTAICAKVSESKETRNVAFFDSFQSDAPFDIYFVQSDVRKIVVEGNEEMFSQVLTEVSDKTLSISLKEGIFNNIKLKVIVFSPVVEEIISYGSGNVVCGNIVMAGEDIDIVSCASGDISVENLTCCELDLKSKGSGKVQINGNVRISDEVDVELDASGNIILCKDLCCNKLSALLNASGDVCFKGATSIYGDVEFESNGSGQINVANLKCSDIEILTDASGSISVRKAEISGNAKLKINGSGDIFVEGRCNSVQTSVNGSGDVKGNLLQPLKF